MIRQTGESGRATNVDGYPSEHLRVTIRAGTCECSGHGAEVLEAGRGCTVIADTGRVSAATARAAVEAIRRGRHVQSILPASAGSVLVHDADTGGVELIAGGTWGSAVAYRDAGDTLYVSTSLPWLRRQGTRDPADVLWLAQAMLGSDPPEGTPYSGIGHLPLGHRLRWRPGWPLRVDRWYSPPLEDPRSTAEEWVERYRERLRGVLAEVIGPGTADVHVLMSAGLDSTTVAAFAAELIGLRRRVRAMVHTPLPPAAADGPSDEGWVRDDLPAAQTMARRWPNIHVEPLRNDALETPFDVLPSYYRDEELPVLAPTNMVWVLAGRRRAATAQVGAVLTGQSGNRCYSYRLPRLTGPLLRAASPGAAIDALRARARATGAPLWRVLASDVAGPKLSDRRRPRSRTPLPDAGLAYLAPHVRAELAELEQPSLLHAPWGPGTSMRENVLSLPLLAGRPTRLVDVLSAPQLLGLVASLPATAFVGVGSGRSFARRVMHGYVPDAIRLRHQLGSQSADAQSVLRDRGGLLVEIDALLADPGVREVLDVERMRRDLQHPTTDRAPMDAWLGRALALGLFVQGQPRS